jgi:hypothetical protein
MTRPVLTFFDKLEDNVRGFLSKRPILYAIVASVGVVLVWRGVWHTADEFPFLNGPASFILGTAILLVTGIFVSAFVGNKIILTGLKGEKKLAEMTRNEVEEAAIEEKRQIEHIEKTLAHLEKEVHEMRRD